MTGGADNLQDIYRLLACDIITAAHIAKKNDKAIVRNIVHFDNVIVLAFIEK